ncbi:hypothetical protein GCM10028806_59640 [Spirosoma terrae]
MTALLCDFISTIIMPDQEELPGLSPYQVIVDKNLKKLVERVNQEIKRGYVSVGGMQRIST